MVMLDESKNYYYITLHYVAGNVIVYLRWEFIAL